MKKFAARLLSAALAVVMLTTLFPVFAEDTAYPDIAGHWAQATLLKAVEDGYIVGSGKGLEPDGAIDRAQTVTIINRVLKAQQEADLAGKTDVPDGCWYRPEMEKAAALGCINSFSAATMTAPLTRGEAMTILSRAFSLTEAQPDYAVLSAFSDASGISGEVKNAVASLVSDGFVNGSCGRLTPQSRVTRAEFLTMLYRIIDGCDIFGCDETEVTLAQSGSAVIRGCQLSSLKASGSYDTAALACDGDIKFAPKTAKKVIVGAGSGKIVLGGAIENVHITGADRAVDVGGAVSGRLAVSAAGARITVSSGNVVNELIVLAGADNCNVTINGTVKNLTVSASGCAVSGTGRVENAQINVRDCSAAVGAGGLEKTEIEFTAPELLPAGEPLTVQAGFKNAPTVTGCALQWYVDGKSSGSAETNFALKNGAVAEYSPTVNYSKNMTDKMAVGLALTYCKNGALQYIYAQTEVALENYPASHYVAEETARVNALITTYQYPATVLYNTTKYTDWTMKAQCGAMAKGTAVTCTSSVAFSSVQVRLPSGEVCWLAYDSISRPAGNFTRKEDYAAGDKELWVNGRKYQSSTDYLVWVSLSCQKVNVFAKGADGWSLIKVFPCASGASSTPTPVGTYKISYKQDRWSYTTYWCGPITGFYNGYAFHSWLTNNDGSAHDHTMGRPASHGCLRMEDAGAQYMHTLPMGTTVAVF